MKSARRLLVAALCLALPSLALAGVPTNSLQDCWTTSVEVEFEQYSFSPADPNLQFSWQHRIEQTCSNYSARIVGQSCSQGLNRPSAPPFTRAFNFGQIDPDPSSFIRTFSVAFLPHEIPVGEFDWFLLVECDDSGNGIPFAPDGDPDEACGISLGLDPAGPLVAGPQPTSFLDADAGGDPVGRQAGEDRSTRPWCFVNNE